MNELFYSLFLFVRFRVIRGCVIFLLFISPLETKAAEAPSYKGVMRIPIDLITTDGIPLETGQYELEVKFETAGYVLSFSSGSHVKALVRPVPGSDAVLTSALIPIVGTHYLRPSTEPLPSPWDRVGTFTNGTMASAVLPPSLPQRFSFSRGTTLPKPLTEVAAPVVVFSYRTWV